MEDINKHHKWRRAEMEDAQYDSQFNELQKEYREVSQRQKELRSRFLEENDAEDIEISKELELLGELRETDEWVKTENRIDGLKAQLGELLSRFLEHRYPGLTTKKEKIITLKRRFGIPHKIVVGRITRNRQHDGPFNNDFFKHGVTSAVDCSEGYYHNFPFLEGNPPEEAQGTVLWEGEDSYITDRQKEYRGTDELSDKKKKRVIKRDGERCVRCGSEDGLNVHHITSVSSGGSHDLENLAILCTDCHKEAHEGDFGLGVTAYDDDKEQFRVWAEDWEWFENLEKRRMKEMLKHLNGVGPATISRLFERYSRVEEVLNAGTEDVSETPYVSGSAARSIIASLAQQL